MAFATRISKEALGINVVVRRRARAGIAPFSWEVHGADTAEPLHVAPERFTSMEEAYKAGQSRLMEFIPQHRPQQPTWNSRWHARSTGFAETETTMAPVG